MRLRFPKFLVGPYRELKRPSFPVNEKLTEVRGDVNAVKPVIQVKRQPINFDELPTG